MVKEETSKESVKENRVLKNSLVLGGRQGCSGKF